MEKKYYVKNIVNQNETLENCSIVIRDGIIVEVKNEACPVGIRSYDYAIPGFIDMHTHGGNGHELMDNSVDALNIISEFYLQNGTTSFLSSTVTDLLSKTEAVLDTASKFVQTNEQCAMRGTQAKCIGIHLEGPWLSPRNIGAQNTEYCIVPDNKSFALIQKYSEIIKMATFSYHTTESEELLQLLIDNKIIPACGHDETLDEKIILGFHNGIQVVTHIYCVTSTFQRKGGLKHLGTLEMALMTDGVKVEVIADGKHITKYFWDFIIHNKKVEDIIIISDSMRCAGLPESPDMVYKLGSINVVIDNGVAWLEDKSAFAGSVATMYKNFKRLIKEWNVNINDAVRMTSYNQSILLCLENLGGIKEGKTADILLLDRDLNLQKIIKTGNELSH